PFTSFLALESESAYARQGIERRDRPWDFELLGAALPHTLPIEDPQLDLRDAPTPGELLLGALSAPLGCSRAGEDKQMEDKSEVMRPDAQSAALSQKP